MRKLLMFHLSRWNTGHALSSHPLFLSQVESVPYKFCQSTRQAAQALWKTLQSRQKYRVYVQNLRAEAQGDAVLLNFDQVDKWYDETTYSTVVDYSSHSETLVRQDCTRLAVQ